MLIPIVIPLLTLGAVRYLARGVDASRSAESGPSAADEPSPLVVLDAFLCMGEQPPPPVVAAAIGHAESLGYRDLADELVRVFVLPAVLQVERDALPRERPRAGTMPVTGAPTWAPAVAAPASWPSAGMTPAPAAAAARSHAAAAATPPASSADAAPLGASVASTSASSARVPPPVAATTPPGTYSTVVPADMIDAEALEVLEELASTGGRAAKVELLAGPAATEAKVELLAVPAAAEPEGAAPSSPIDGVRADAWAAFVGRVAREPLTFSARHHVGQFRARRERLRELGIDPATVIGSPEAQLAALDADMRDAYQHACSSGLVNDYLGTTLHVTAGEDAQPAEVTLSGVLGVIQAAGLEGAVQWLEQPADRTRFINTTQAFLRCNGVF